MASIDVKVLLSAQDHASKVLNDFGRNMDSVAANARSVGTSLIAIGAAPTAALLGSAKAAIDFESSFAGVRKTVDASEAEFAQLSQNFRDISKVTPLAIKDLNRIGELAGSLGISGVDNLTKFTKTIAEIGITSNLTEEEAAMAFGRIANIMQEPIKNVDRMGAVVIDLGNKFATTESEITEFAQRIAGAGSIAGLTTANIFEIGAAMASVGVEAEAGGTAVQKVLIEMTKSVAQGGEQLALFAKASGQTSAEFKKNFEEDAMGAFTHFVEGLGKQGDDAINTLADLGLEDQRLIRSFLSLANAGDLLNDTLEVGSKAWIENSALTEEAAKRYATTESQIQIAKNNLYDLGITIGTIILPAINSMMQALIPIVQKIAEFAAQHPNITAGLLLFGAAIGALGVALVGLSIILPGLTILIGALSAISLPVIGIIALVAIGIVALGAVIYLIIKNFDDWKIKVFEVWTALTDFVAEIPGRIGEGIQTIIDWVSKLPGVIQDFFINLFTEKIPFAVGFAIGYLSVEIPNMVQNIITWLSTLPGKALSIFTQFKDFILLKINETAINIQTEISSWPEKIRSFIASIPGIVAGVFNSAKETILGIMADIYNGVKGWWDKIMGFLNAIVDAGNAAIGAVQRGLEAGKKAAGGGKQAGGIVPGAIGQPRIVLAHGGEEVVPVGKRSSGGGFSGSLVFNVNIGMYAGTEIEKRNVASELYTSLVHVARAQNKSVSEVFGG